MCTGSSTTGIQIASLCDSTPAQICSVCIGIPKDSTG